MRRFLPLPRCLGRIGRDHTPSCLRSLVVLAALQAFTGPSCVRLGDLDVNDVDGDNIANIYDFDIDGDGVPNEVDPDIDGDGILNGSDPDVDGDGVVNENDDDVDSDRISNEIDPDGDADGLASLDADPTPNGYCGTCNGRCIGARCETCLPGYFGDHCASACTCANGTCDDGWSGTGHCRNCTPTNWALPDCDTCSPGFTGPACETLVPVALIAAGWSHSCAVLNDGSLKCWGYNNDGELGLGDRENRGDETGEMGDTLRATDLGANHVVRAIAAGFRHTCALLDGGTVKCWGGSDGALGNGDARELGDTANEMGDNLPAVDLGSGQTATAVAAGTDHTCVLLITGTVKCWGLNASGQLGLGDTNLRGDEPGEIGDNLPPVDLGTGRVATALVAGGEHTCALLDNGNVKCWGVNTHGELGLGNKTARGDDPGEMGDNLPAVDLGTGRVATALAASEGSHTCALLDNGTLKCWGRNAEGQLGLGDSNNRGDAANEMGDALPALDLGTGRSAMAVVAGGVHTCALLDNGAIKCWGRNSEGQTGLGTNANYGDDGSETGNGLPAVDLGAGRRATTLAAGGMHTCALLDNGAVKCWGNNEQGQLGLQDTLSRGDDANEMGDNLPVVRLRGVLSNLESSSGTLRPVFKSTFGSYAHFAPNVVNFTVTPTASAAGTLITVNGVAVTSGTPSSAIVPSVGNGIVVIATAADGARDECTIVTTTDQPSSVTGLSAGDRHTCARFDNGMIKCWGCNAKGELGLGDTNWRGNAAEEMGEGLPVVALGAGRSATTVVGGRSHTCAWLDNGMIKCWGYNENGELGQGDSRWRGYRTGSMGDTLAPVNLRNRSLRVGYCDRPSSRLRAD